MKKKFQVFISSTYTDLIEERQRAVTAVLDSNHIPAGMELFKANNQDQMKVIRQWIDESDVFMLILGGRYGSLDPATQKSYTHLEYEYALEKQMPIFTLILTDKMIRDKFTQSNRPMNDFLEVKNKKKHAAFVEQTKTGSIVRYLESIYEIDGAVMSSLHLYENDPLIGGWIKTLDTNINTHDLNQEIQVLKDEIISLRSENDSLMRLKNQSYDFDFSKVDEYFKNGIMNAVIQATHMVIPINHLKSHIHLYDDYTDMIQLLLNPYISRALVSGITVPEQKDNVVRQYVLNSIIPFLLKYDFVIPTEYPRPNMITYRINSVGGMFFRVITQNKYD